MDVGADEDDAWCAPAPAPSSASPSARPTLPALYMLCVDASSEAPSVPPSVDAAVERETVDDDDDDDRVPPLEGSLSVWPRGACPGPGTPRIPGRLSSVCSMIRARGNAHVACAAMGSGEERRWRSRSRSRWSGTWSDKLCFTRAEHYARRSEF
jgi:hypothetical protein